MTLNELKQNLTLPVIGAPMFLVSGIDLVVAQCCNGIVGAFPALNARTASELDNWISQIKSRIAAFESETGKKAAPYAVNLVVHGSNTRLDEDLSIVIRHQVPLVITSLSAPDRHAKKAAAAGVDGLVLVCTGAGGHGGQLNPFALIAEVKQFYDGAIILSGAIANGYSILAASALGADFSYIGTAFLACEESNATVGHKEMVVDCTASEILSTPYFSGTHSSYMIPSIIAAGVDPNEAVIAQPRKDDFIVGKERPKAWKGVWSAGQGVGQISSVMPVADLIRRLKSEYDAAKQSLLQGNSE